jgi:hypothetical protein
VVALIAQLAIRIVFDDRNAVAVGEQNQFVATPLGQSRAARVLEVGQHVHELRPRPQWFLQHIGAQAVVVTGNTDVFRAIHVEGLERAQIRRRLDQHAIARVDEQLADQVKRLL